MELNKENWKEEHLNFMHEENYDWCPLCQNRKNGEAGGSDLGISVGDSIKNKDVFGRV